MNKFCISLMCIVLLGLLEGFLSYLFPLVSHNFPVTVHNKVEPSRESTLPKIILKSSLALDLESPEIAASGMGVPGEFDVDAVGDIYIVAFRNTENFIYKFDADGRFLYSFGKGGQGPGELQWPMRPTVIKGDQLSIYDSTTKNLLTYDNNGRYIKNMRTFDSFLVEAVPNGKFLVQAYSSGSKASYEHGVFLHDSHFKRIKELDRCRFLLDSGTLPPNVMWRITPSFIYLFNSSRGYDIWVFDHEGNPVRRILKDSRPVQATRELRRLFLGKESFNPATDSFFPKPLPPVNQIFVDDEDRVYALTYESGLGPGEYRIDVFDNEGRLITKWSLNLRWAGIYQGSRYIVVKNGSIYFYRTKDNGFHVLYRYPLSYR